MNTINEITTNTVDAAVANNNHSLISPLVDFLTLGGASLLIFLLIEYFSLFTDPKSLEFSNFFSWNMQYIVNFPHFAFSYLIFYQGYFNKLFQKELSFDMKIRYVLAGFIIPILIIIYSLYQIFYGNVLMLGYMANFMLFLVGWHYVKQGFGVLIVLSSMNKFFYSKFEHSLLFTNAYFVWILSWFMLNLTVKEHNYWDIAYYTFDVPIYIYKFLWVVVAGLTMVLIFNFLYRFVTTNKFPPINGIVAYISALYLWLIIARKNPCYLMWIPFFHSLQYLPFVARYKYNESKEKIVCNNKRLLNNYKFITIGILLGASGFVYIPVFLDNYINYNQQIFNSNLFLFLFYIFINIHHYFMDNTIWRRNNPSMKKYIFG